MVPDGVEVENPAFDVTPAKYVAAIITERGIAKAPYEKSLRKLAEEPVHAKERRHFPGVHSGHDLISV